MGAGVDVFNDGILLGGIKGERAGHHAPDIRLAVTILGDEG